MSLSFDISAADLINEQLQVNLKRPPEDAGLEEPEPKKRPEEREPLLELDVPIEPEELSEPAAAAPAPPPPEPTWGHLNKSGEGFDFQLLDQPSFDKIYEIMVLASIIKTYPEIVTDLQINRTSLSTLDDATRQHKFLECKLYVLIDLECQNMKALTGIFTTLMRLVIQLVFPSVSKPTETVLTTALANVDKKSNTLFYIHAVNAIKERNFAPPNIMFGFLTEIIKVVTVLLSEYLIRIQQQKR